MKTISDKLLFALAVGVSAFVIVTSGILFQTRAGAGWPFLMPVALVAVAWLARQLSVEAAPQAGQPSPRRKITEAILLAGLILGVALLSSLDWATSYPAFKERSGGVLTGVVLAIYANAVPKQTGSAQARSVRSAIGWSLALAGIGYMLAWLFLPLAQAADTGLAVMLCAALFAAARSAWLVMKHRSLPPL